MGYRGPDSDRTQEGPHGSNGDLFSPHTAPPVPPPGHGAGMWAPPAPRTHPAAAGPPTSPHAHPGTTQPPPHTPPPPPRRVPQQRGKQGCRHSSLCCRAQKGGEGLSSPLSAFIVAFRCLEPTPPSLCGCHLPGCWGRGDSTLCQTLW